MTVVDPWAGLNARLRTALTLGLLAVVLLIAVSWGAAQLTAPLPGKADPPICVETQWDAGDELVPADVTVSVLNASQREGLAGRTMQLLVDQGFAPGQTGNAPAGTVVDAAEIWTDKKNDPAAKLLRTRLGPVLVRPEGASPVVGITVVVGDQFGDLLAGEPSITLGTSTTLCSPPS